MFLDINNWLIRHTCDFATGAREESEKTETDGEAKAPGAGL